MRNKLEKTFLQITQFALSANFCMRKLLFIFFYFFSFYIPLNGFSSPENSPGQICCSAKDLISPDRVDVIAKYIYAKLREWDAKTTFGKEIYYSHLKLMNNFYEFFPIKNSYRDFELHFNNTLDEIKKNGFDPVRSLVPIDGLGRIWNGAHRTAACLLYNEIVYGEIFYPLQEKLTYDNAHLALLDYGLDFFSRHDLEEKYLDAMALQYSDLKEITRIILALIINEEDQINYEIFLQKIGRTVYKKDIILTADGIDGFIQHITHKENVAQLILNREPLYFRVYLFDHLEKEKMVENEEKLRRLTFTQPHYNYISQNHKESILLSRLFFNKNSLEFINNKPYEETLQFNKFLETYQSYIANSLKPEEWFVIYNTASVFDSHFDEWIYLYFKDPLALNLDIPIKGYNLDRDTTDAILFDPQNHFFYKGIKFFAEEKFKINPLKPLHIFSY